jgi:hypothetical protein
MTEEGMLKSTRAAPSVSKTEKRKKKENIELEMTSNPISMGMLMEMIYVLPLAVTIFLSLESVYPMEDEKLRCAAAWLKET